MLLHHPFALWDLSNQWYQTRIGNATPEKGQKQFSATPDVLPACRWNNESINGENSRYYLSGNQYELDPLNDSWDYIPEGVSKIKICQDSSEEICKANKFCRRSSSELFLNDFEPLECQ